MAFPYIVLAVSIMCSLVHDSSCEEINNNSTNVLQDDVKEFQKIKMSEREYAGVKNRRKPRSAVSAERQAIANEYVYAKRDGFTNDNKEDSINTYTANSNIETLITEVSEKKSAMKRPRNTTRIGTDDSCKLRTNNASLGSFRHNVYYYGLNFVYMRIVPVGDYNIKEATGIVGADIWVWTYFGKKGALEFLNWPIEFEIWSLGLLTFYIKGPLEIPLNKAQGKCDKLVVGEIPSDTIISKALVQLPEELMKINEDLKDKYGPSFFCYKRRMFLNPKFFYILCKHMVCPVEAIQYQCCSYAYSGRKMHRVIRCEGETHKFDSLWWVWPTVVAVILFAFFPLLLMNIASNLSCRYDKREQQLSLRNVAANEQPQERIVFLDDNFPVTLCSTLWYPITKCCFQKFSQSSRVNRFFLPFISLGLILLQILLDCMYLHGFVLTSIKTGVPLGFRSMAAGINESKRNFMPLLGGPYIAIGVYVFITCLAVSIPSSLSDFLASGLQDRSKASDVFRSALLFDLNSVGRLGSVRAVQPNGFQKIYNVYLGQFYMLLNVKFWKEVGSVQKDRWVNFASSICHYIVLPFYVMMCIAEIILCVGINGLPIVSFAITIIRAYSFCNIFGLRFRSMNICYKVVALFVSIILVISVLFFLYMFCTIFMDATLFVTRIFTFTYTGIVIYPKLSYGYLIFAFTVVYYLWDCVKNYSMFYWRVLKVTVWACEHVQRPSGKIYAIVDNERHVKGVEESIFEHVIETNCPRRKQVFVSLLKLCIILGIIGASLGLLTKTDTFRELHVVMHVGTALFTCALPMILKSMCRGPKQTYRSKQFECDIKRSVADFVCYLEGGSASNDSDSN